MGGSARVALRNEEEIRDEPPLRVARVELLMRMKWGVDERWLQRTVAAGTRKERRVDAGEYKRMIGRRRGRGEEEKDVRSMSTAR